MEQSIKREVVEQVIEMAESHIGAEVEVSHGVRVDPTDNGASVEVDHGIDDGLDVRLSIMDAVRDHDDLELVYADERWDEGHWSGAIEECTG